MVAVAAREAGDDLGQRLGLRQAASTLTTGT